MRFTATASLLIASFVLCAPAQAEKLQKIGLATAVVNDVRAEFDEDNRKLTEGDGVHQDELIVVGRKSIGEIVLEDDTKLALGAGSRLLLDKFVYNGKKSKGDILINLVEGTFRFVTGIASKASYRIRTPAASITVRGTIFDVFVPDTGELWLLLMDGGVTACNDRGSCKKMDKRGTVLRVTSDGTVNDPVPWALLEGTDVFGFDIAFPFVVNPPLIDPLPFLSKEAILNGDIPQDAPKAEPKPKKKKTYKKKKKKAKKKYKPKKKYVKKKKRKKKTASSGGNGSDVGKALIGIGAAIAIGSALKGGKKGGGCKGHNCY